MQGTCNRPKTARSGGILLLALLLGACSSWQEVPDAAVSEPVKTPDFGPIELAKPAPEPQPAAVVPQPAAPPPVAILLTSHQPAYFDVAVELAGHFDEHSVFDLSTDRVSPVSVLRSINDGGFSAVIAIGLRAARAAVSMADTPVVFSQVFNHQEYDLLGTASRGVAAVAPMPAQMAAWKNVDPDLRRIGIIVGAGHEALLASARDAARKHDVELDIRVSKSDQETLFLFRRMMTEIDGFWLVPDNRVLSSRVLHEMLADASRHNVAVVVPNDSMLQIGGAIAISTVASDIATNVARVVRQIQAGNINNVPAMTELTEVRVTINDEIMNRRSMVESGELR